MGGWANFVPRGDLCFGLFIPVHFSSGLGWWYWMDGWMGKRARKYGNGTQENFEIGLLFFHGMYAELLWGWGILRWWERENGRVFVWLYCSLFLSLLPLPFPSLPFHIPPGDDTIMCRSMVEKYLNKCVCMRVTYYMTYIELLRYEDMNGTDRVAHHQRFILFWHAVSSAAFTPLSRPFFCTSFSWWEYRKVSS